SSHVCSVISWFCPTSCRRLLLLLVNLLWTLLPSPYPPQLRPRTPIQKSVRPPPPPHSYPPPSSPPLTSKTSFFLFSILLLITSITLASTFALVFPFFTSSSSHSPTATTSASSIFTRRLSSHLSRPTVILISSDGFRYGYHFKSNLPNIHRLIINGTEAVPGLIPVFPSLTFPNHYSIVTGLYPSFHGIINNHFIDPSSGESFTMNSHEPKWWLGEPLWETVVNHGLPAATYFWPGSEVVKGSWHCPPDFCKKYDGSVPFEQRVDTVLNYFDLPKNQIPAFITLYFEDPDHQGHQFGPDDPEITSAVIRIDGMIGRLIHGLEKRGVFEDVSVILLGDHGMVGNCDKKTIFLEDLSPWIKIPPDWIQSNSPLITIRPPPTVSPAEVVRKMNEALSSGKVENGNKLKMFLKEDLPKRLHYSENYRIPPIVGLLEESYMVENTRSKKKECGGSHGYDNLFFSMRTIFVAHGPQFQRGRKVPSFENVEIYNVITEILGLKGAENNGSALFPSFILLPRD
ncbi:venom phosphodiesterase 2-like, partial [Phalaenopsis equestris]|uniref:venom phosphodiesterase 2-like n=1 Tax=Phalaenopsis equestris TaxID=78828 RepID=UPI0009E57BC0